MILLCRCEQSHRFVSYLYIILISRLLRFGRVDRSLHSGDIHSVYVSFSVLAVLLLLSLVALTFLSLSLYFFLFYLSISLVLSFFLSLSCRESDTHESSSHAYTSTHTFRSSPSADRPVSLSVSLSIYLSLFHGLPVASACLCVRLLFVASLDALHAGHGAFRGEPPLGIVCLARSSVCVTDSVLLRSLSVTSPALIISTYTRNLAHAFPLFPFLSISASSPLNPPSLHLVLCFFLLFSKSDSEGAVSPVVSRLSPPRTSAAFFSPLCPCILPRRESTAVAAVASFAGSLLP